MKIKLLKDHSVRGKICAAGNVVDIHSGVALDLVDRGIAEKVGSKPATKKTSK